MDQQMPSQGTRFLRGIPLLAAQDLAVSLKFYADLGFLSHSLYNDYAVFTMGNEESGEVDIHWWLCPDRNIAENTGCQVEVTKVDPLYEKCRVAGAMPQNGSLQERPWGTREFVLVDLAGNIITFFERID